MKKLIYVTMTGADDSVTAEDLVQVSERFPDVEWGILFCGSQQGMPRYPSAEWLDASLHKLDGLNLCAHLCGRWVRDLVIEGRFTWKEQRSLLTQVFQRIQINFHGQFHRQHAGLFDVLMKDGRTFILQCDGVNDIAAMRLVEQGEGRILPLFDASGGSGVLPKQWPTAWPGVVTGYAGWLGPDNIAEQLPLIREASNDERYWIDMETNVRSVDDHLFDIAKVEDVLEAVYRG